LGKLIIKQRLCEILNLGCPIQQIWS